MQRSRLPDRLLECRSRANYHLDPSEQIPEAFTQVEMVLREGGMSLDDVVEMTSYHAGLREHLEQFRAIRAQHVREPHPAWTAVEVAGFASEGVVVEKVVARRT